VTTEKFLIAFGFESLRDLPDLEALKDAGLLDDPSPPGESRGTVGPRSSSADRDRHLLLAQHDRRLARQRGQDNRVIPTEQD
jgi:hypothetical protein